MKLTEELEALQVQQAQIDTKIELVQSRITNQELIQDIYKLKGTVKSLEANNSNLESKMESVKSYNVGLEDKVEELEIHINELQGLRCELEGEIDKIKGVNLINFMRNETN